VVLNIHRPFLRRCPEPPVIEIRFQNSDIAVVHELIAAERDPANSAGIVTAWVLPLLTMLADHHVMDEALVCPQDRNLRFWTEALRADAALLPKLPSPAREQTAATMPHPSKCRDL
jgi:hypothetical protein